MIGAVRIKKVGLIFENGHIGLKITGGLALAAFEFELMGMQVTVPQSVLNDPAKLSEIAFALDGFGVEIRKGTLAIMGAFLRQHCEERDASGAAIALRRVQRHRPGRLSAAQPDRHGLLRQVPGAPVAVSLRGAGLPNSGASRAC